MTAVARYLVAMLLRTQRAVGPSLVLVGLIAWVWSTPPVTLDTVRVVLLVLFGFAAWLGHATATVEDPAQESISISCCGSARRLLVVKWLLATLIALIFPLLMLLGTYAFGWFQVDAVAASGLALLATATLGAGAGTLVGVLLPSRPGWSVGLLVLLTLAQAVPNLSPVQLIAVALVVGSQPPAQWVLWPQLAAGLGSALLLTTLALVAVAWLRGASAFLDRSLQAVQHRPPVRP